MAARVLSVDGVAVYLEGEGPHTVVMLHGWPDTHRLWDAQVAHLLATFPGQLCCARFTLPGFDLTQPPRPLTLQGMADAVARIVDTVSPDRPVTLLLHDWGCVFGYEYLAQHPQRVARLVAVDIGDHNAGALRRSLSARAKWGVAVYQLWLALAWGVGRFVNQALATRMTRAMAAALRCPTAQADIGWQMNYPYAAQWSGGYRKAAPVAPACPTLYFYGQRKPFQFQSQGWLDRLAATPGNEIRAMPTGHWVMVQQPQPFNDHLAGWLARTPAG